jgi:membrane-bound lytic murein transglycosylase D
LEYIDEDSPLFIISDLLYSEIDTIEVPVFTGSMNEEASIFVQPGLMSPPDSVIIPLDSNKYVDRAIEFLLNHRGRVYFSKWLERSSRWFPMMREIAVDEGMPLEILYLSMIESGLNPNIVSPARAVGLWQFMRSTGKMYGLNDSESFWVDERRDPVKSTRAAMQHLRDLYIEFGDWHLALAAYNCGSGCVRRAIRRSGRENPNYWEIRNKLPRETRGYVPKFIAAAKVAMDPEKYDYDLDTLEFHHAFRYDVVKIDSAVNLEALAKAANISLEELKLLNTELIQNSTPPDVEGYDLRIPYGSKDIFALNFAKLTDEEKQPFLVHTVQRRETLSKISRKYGVSTAELAELNGFSGRRARLKVGQKLEIPISPQKYEEETGIAVNEDGEVNSEKLENNSRDIFHIVRRGENLYSIANRYGIRVSDIRNLNDIPYNRDRINIGQKLVIAKKSENKSAEKPEITKLKEPKVIQHKVRRGESLAQIADDYGVTINTIKKHNSIKRNKIYAGEILKIVTGENTNVQPSSKLDENDIVVHKVRKGETISTIAARYGVTESHLKKMNPGTIRGNTIYYGSRLKIIPSESYKGSSSGTQAGVNTAPKYYKIRRGDTLSSIARKFGVSVNSIKAKNKNLDETRLQIGQKIRIQ